MKRSQSGSKSRTTQMNPSTTGRESRTLETRGAAFYQYLIGKLTSRGGLTEIPSTIIGRYTQIEICASRFSPPIRLTSWRSIPSVRSHSTAVTMTGGIATRCADCGEWFPSRIQFKNHHCDYTSSTESYDESVYESDHERPPAIRMKCGYCNTWFPSRRQYSFHAPKYPKQPKVQPKTQPKTQPSQALVVAPTPSPQVRGSFAQPLQ
jgi:hypothetical protein